MGLRCPEEKPAVRPHSLAITSYFGNAIQDYVWEQGWWNHSASDPYWTSELHEQQLQLTFDEWDRRQLSEDSSSGAGYSSVHSFMFVRRILLLMFVMECSHRRRS